MMRHRCAAEDCAKIVPLNMLMCKRHWFMVPKPLRDAIWAGYYRGMDAGYDAAVAAAVKGLRGGAAPGAAASA